MRSEHQEQVALFARAKLHETRHPELRLLFAVPNGGDRNRVVAAKLKSEGVKAGVPDIALPVPVGGYAALFIEMKRLKPRVTKTKGVRMDHTRTTAAQDEWIGRLRAAGNAVVVCWTAEEAWEAIEAYLAGNLARAAA